MARRRILSSPPGAVSTKRGPAKEFSPEDDNVNTESQQMLAIGSLLKKPKVDDKDMEQFGAKVGADRKRLKTLLSERKQQAEEAETLRCNEIASMIQNALQTPIRPVQGEVLTYVGTKIAKNATYVLVTDNFAASKRLSREYERLDSMSKHMQKEGLEPVAEAWYQELAEGERILNMGARVALRNVKKVLGACAEDSGKDATDGEDEDMQNIGEGYELNYELHKNLRYAERGVKRMVKGLPGDEE